MFDKWPIKDPNEILDFDIDWAGTVATPGRAYGDAVVTSVWSVETGDGLLIIGLDSFSAGATKVWLSGGTLDMTYRVRNRIVTNGGRTMDKSGLVTIKEK